ncbi:hypothetical protein GC177_06460 [bacterium]|nr:hypothetical protein [bacterium]
MTINNLPNFCRYGLQPHIVFQIHSAQEHFIGHVDVELMEDSDGFVPKKLTFHFPHRLPVPVECRIRSENCWQYKASDESTLASNIINLAEQGFHLHDQDGRMLPKDAIWYRAENPKSVITGMYEARESADAILAAQRVRWNAMQAQASLAESVFEEAWIGERAIA